MKRQLLILMFAFIGLNANAQWQRINGLYGGRVQSMITDGVNLFANTGSSDGVFLSTDYSNSWNSLIMGNVNALMIDGTTIYAGSGTAVSKSTNNGASFTYLGSVNVSGLDNIYCVLPLSSSDLLVGTHANGLYLSSNGGVSFTHLSTSASYVSSLILDGTDIYAATDYGLLKSNNNGLTWTSLSIGSVFTSASHDILKMIKTGTKIYCAAGYHVCSSADNGMTWAFSDTIGLPNNNYNHDISALASDSSGSRILAGVWNKGAYISTDSGGTWTAINNGLPDSLVYDFAICGSTIFASTRRGISVSTNNGASWTEANNGLLANGFQNYLTGGTSGKVYVSEGEGFYRNYMSTDNGTTWQPGDMVFDSSLVNTFFHNGTRTFAGTSKGGFISDNNGSSWVQINMGIPNPRVKRFALLGTKVFASTSGGGVLISNDNGNTWTSANLGLGSFYTNSLMSVDTNLFVGTNSGVYLYTNNSGNWVGRNSGLTNTDIDDLAVIGTKIFAATFGGGVFLSNDQGNSWTAVNNGLNCCRYVTNLFAYGNNILASSSSTDFSTYTSGGGVYLSTDFGNSWTDVIGLNSRVWSMAASGTSLYASIFGNAHSGIWKRPLGQIINCVAYYTTTYDSIQNNFTLTVDSTSSALATGYHWDFGDGTSSTLVTPPSHMYARDSVYNVCMKIYTASGDSCEYCHIIGKDSLGNIVRTTGFTLNFQNSTTVNIPNIQKETTITISPNPFTSATTISFSEQQTNTTIKLTDVLGKEIKTIHHVQGKQTLIEKGEMKPGIYFLQITDENKNVVNRKIIIQ